MISPASFLVRCSAAALVAAICPAHAQVASEQAVHAAVADGVSTTVGIAAGAAEINPVGAVLSIGLKPVVMRYASTLPDVQQPAVYAAAASMWGGAAANNACVVAAVLSGGAFGPVCVALGVAWGLKTWNDSEEERTFWEGCAMLRQYAHEPDLKCVYTPIARKAQPPQAQPAPVAGLQAP